MAPFDSPYSSNLTNKISPLLEGQVPDFIQADHPVFVKFLKSYFEYLEAGELRVSVVIDNLLLELETESFVLDSDDNKVVLEDATDATTGKFIVGETITGSTSKATATILVDDLGNSTKPRLFITGQQQFQTGETITGGTSGSTGTVVRYRANPVQNIQQLLEYANVDNTIYDFLDQLRDSFMNAIPKELAAGVDQRNLIKNIRELYRAKGTSEGHKIFMRMLLDENIEVTYPNQYMMRVSDGDWSNQTIIRCSPGANAAGGEMIGQLITGQTSGSTAVVANALSTAEGGEAITEFEINPASLTGTFTDGEVVQGTSTVQDVTMSFTVRGIVTSYAVTDGGKLYSVGDDLNLDTQTVIGNGEASAEVGSIKTGSVSRVIIDDVGANYRVGDTLTFTTTESGTTTKASTGFVSVVDGSLAINGTDSSSSDAGDNLVLESGSTSAFIEFDIGLEDETGVFLLNRTTTAGANAGEKIIVEPATDIQFTLDSYGTDSDTFALESGTVATGEIARVFLKDGGEGYSLLPSVAVTSTNGASAVLTADTNDIGVVDSVNVTKQGFKYTEAPEGRFNANFLLKDVTGTFGETNTLASSGHTGVVKSFNSTTKVLKATFEDVQRITMETGASEGIELEQNSGDNDHLSAFIIDAGVFGEGSTLLEDATAGAGRKLLLDGTAEVAIDQLVLNGTDGSSSNAGSFIISEGSNDGDSYVNGSGVKFITEQTTIVGETSGKEGLRGGYGVIVPGRTKSKVITVENEDESLLIDGFENVETYDFLILDGTDSVGSNSGERLINESSNNNNNQIILNGTDASLTDAGFVLLNDIETASGSIALNGTDSSSASAGDNIVNEQPPDFSAEGTTITDSGGASGTIVSVDIAKGTTSIGTKAETVPSYGVSIKSLIGEDLNRIQDSVYYQQFSYEIEAASSQADYLTELKKAIHPAGFNVFGKVSIATLVSAAIPTAGASLGGGFTSNFSPILASTFTILFSEEVSRATGVMEYGVNNFDDEILLETDETNVGGELLLDGTDSSSTNAGGKFISETLTNRFIDFEGIEITHGLSAGNVGVLLDETDGDKIISESTVAFSFNMLLEPESTIDGGNFLPGFSGTDSNILLDGTDSSGTNAGDKFEFEIGNNDSSFFTISLDTVRNTDNVLNEDGGNQYLETAGKGDISNKEINVISRVTSKVHLPNKNSSSLPNGLITMGETPFGNDPAAIDLEMGNVGGSGSGKLVLVGFEQINVKGGVNRVTGANDGLLFEDAVDDNVGSGFSFDDFGSYSHHTMVLNGTDGSSTNAGDNITLESGVVDLHGNYSGGSILGEVTFNHSYMSIEDIIRPARFLADIDGGLNLFNIVMEQDEIGSFKQEDGTTAPQSHGDSFLLEDLTVSAGTNNKLILEKQYLIPEDEVITTTSHGFDLKGVIPSENFTNSDIEPYTYTSDVVTRPIDTLVLEDLGKEATNIQLESGTEGGIFGNLVYDATGTDADDNVINENSTIGIDGYNLGTFQGGANFQIEKGNMSQIDFMVLNGTNGSSANAGDPISLEDSEVGRLTSEYILGEEVILETATFYNIMSDPVSGAKLSVPLTFENSFDSTLKQFDSSLLTFDSTL
jgi:hypothetical protein